MPHVLRHRFLGVFLACSLGALATHSVPYSALAAPVVASEASKLSSDLQQTLEKQGGFEALYKAIAPEGKQSDLLLLYHPEKKYILTRIDLSEDTRKWLILDYKSLKTERKAFDIWLVTSEWKQRFSASITDLLQRVDNPLGAAYAIARALPKGPNDAELNQAVTPGSVNIALGLTATNLELQVGIGTKTGGLQASWLSESLFREAVDQSQTADILSLKYASKRSIHIDKRNGLLKEDSWPDPQRSGSRVLKLERVSKLGSAHNTPWQAFVPQLQTLPDGNLPVGDIMGFIPAAFLTSLGEPLQKSPAMTWMDTHRSEVEKTLLNAIRQHIRTHQPITVSSQAGKAYYARLKAQYDTFSAAGGTLSFDAFAQQMRQGVTQSNGDFSNVVIPPGFQEKVQQMRKETLAAMQQMGQTVRPTVGKMLDVGMPKVWEALLIEQTHAFIDAALAQHSAAQ